MLESNELIAKFMGRPGKVRGDLYWVNVPNIMWVNISEMKFSQSWDWLMPVVEKIESIDCVKRVTIMNTHVHISISESPKIITHLIESSKVVTESMNIPNRPEATTTYTKQMDTKISAVYYCVVEFIKWYNLNKFSCCAPRGQIKRN